MIVWFRDRCLRCEGHHRPSGNLKRPSTRRLHGQALIAFFALAAVVLAVTGAEALYADMGHFGRRAITRGWLFLVLPACVLNYLGQGLLLGDETAVRALFSAHPGVGTSADGALATAATVIASQAVITRAYSVASRAHSAICRDCG
jgi:KUP system potassium uptake protein